MAIKHPTTDRNFSYGILDHAHSVSANNFFLRRFTAGLLAVSVGFFSFLPEVLAQQAVPASAAASQTSTSTASQPSITPATVPSATPSQEARASALFQKGTEALRAQKSTKAMKLFEKARLLDPANGTYLAAYEIARQQQIGGFVQTAKMDKQLGKATQAKQSLQAALNLDPGNQYAAEHLQSLSDTEDGPAVESSAPMPHFSTGIVELAPAPIRATFHVRADAQQLIPQIFHAYGITPILDDSVPKKMVRIDLDHATFAQASTAVQLTTGTFTVPLDPEHVVVAKDTKQNRLTYDRLLLETVFLPGVDPKEMTEPINMIKNVFGVRQVSVRAKNGTLSIRAPEETLRAINATLKGLYIDKPEVILDVRVYQVNDSRQEDLGVAFPQTLDVFNVSSQLSSIISQNQSTITQLIASGLVNPGDLAGIAALLVGLGLVNGTVLNQPFALFGNGLTLSGLSFGSTTANASLNISNTRELDHIQLRASDSQKESFLIGSKYPIVTQSYSAGTQSPTSSTSLASLISGSTQSNLGATNPLALAPTVQYVDLGLTMKASAHVLQSNNIQMQLQLKIAALSGATVNGSPIINNRSFTTAIQVHDGGSAMMTSSISSTESRALTGIPGLSELPGFAWTASPSTQLTVGRLLIVVTPHIVSATHSRAATQQFPLSAGLSAQ